MDSRVHQVSRQTAIERVIRVRLAAEPPSAIDRLGDKLLELPPGDDGYDPLVRDRVRLTLSHVRSSSTAQPVRQYGDEESHVQRAEGAFEQRQGARVRLRDEVPVADGREGDAAEINGLPQSSRLPVARRDHTVQAPEEDAEEQ